MDISNMQSNGGVVVAYHLYPQPGAPVSAVNCAHCGFRNVISCGEYRPKTRLNSNRCMHCGEVLRCPECDAPLIEGLETELDGILLDANPACSLWFGIW